MMTHHIRKLVFITGISLTLAACASDETGYLPPPFPHHTMNSTSQTGSIVSGNTTGSDSGTPAGTLVSSAANKTGKPVSTADAD